MSKKFDVSSFLKNLLAYIIIFMVMVILGCFNFAELGFDTSLLMKLEFWGTVLFRVALLVAVRVAAMLIFLDVARAKNTDLKNAKALNDKYMKLKGTDFPEYIDTVENPSIKIRAWKEQVNKQLAKLERKAKQKDRSLYFKKGDTYNIQKENNYYCKRRKELEEQLSKDFIDNNLDTLIIKKKYPKIDPAVFSLPVGTDNFNKQYQITAKTRNAVISSIAISAAIAIISQSIIHAMTVSPTDVYMLAVFISIISDLIFVVVQFWSGIISAFSKIKTEEVTPYINRNEILKKYLFWKDPGKHDVFAKWVAQLEILDNNKEVTKTKPEA